jgi:hypothetical protein
VSLSHAGRVLRRSDYEWRPLATGAGPFARGTPPPGAERANRFNELLPHIGTVRSDGIGRFVTTVGVLGRHPAPMEDPHRSGMSLKPTNRSCGRPGPAEAAERRT